MSRLLFSLGGALALAAASAGCGASSGGGGGARHASATAPQGLSILARGGQGAGAQGAGGAGGEVDIFGAAASDLEVLETGYEDAAFDAPPGAPLLGDNPRTVSASGALLAEQDGTILGDDAATPATGLHVLPGVTLALAPNLAVDGTGFAADLASLEFEAGVWIEGALAALPSEETGLPATPTSAIRIAAREVVVAADGAIVASGATVTGIAAGAGEVRLLARQAIVVHGAIRARGGDGGPAGGAGGAILLQVEEGGAGDIFVTGALDASGGAASEATGAGGSGGSVEVGSAQGGVFLAGTIRATGGAGGASGGAGGGLAIFAAEESPGGARACAAIDVSGGASTVSGTAGAGGGVEVEDCGFLRISGSIEARGGAALGGGDAGGGGEVVIGAPSSTPSGLLTATRRRGVSCSAAIDVSGGRASVAGAGGDAGRVAIRLEDLDDDEEGGSGLDVAGGAPIALLGYALVDASGGAGVASGGDGGSATLTCDLGDAGGVAQGTPLLNRVPLRARGGAAPAGAGGDGGATVCVGGTLSPILNRAALDARGGDGARGGAGGSCVCSGYSPDNGGALDASGGAATTGAGGDGGVAVCAGFEVKNAAPLRADGGASRDATGGRGGSIVAAGTHVRTDGDLSARGGAGVTGGDALQAGEGPQGQGAIAVTSSGDRTALRGRLDASGGSGTDAPGKAGAILIDGIVLDLPSGVRRY